MPTFHPNPPRIPADLESELRVLHALRTLPPPTHILARLRILDAGSNRDREIDFLVIHPELGLVIVEVKGKGVEPRGDHWERFNRDRQAWEAMEHPGDQLAAQQYILFNHLRSAEVGFIPEITRVLALPFLPVPAGQDLGPDLPACRILTAEKLKEPFLALRNAVSGGQAWADWCRRPEAEPHRVRPATRDRILAALLPRLLPPPSLADLLVAEGTIQETASGPLLTHLAQNFSKGRFHVQGAPGSGKSLLARMVTRIWAAEGRRVLVVAFNRAISYATYCELRDLDDGGQAKVIHFHELAETLLADAGQPLPERLDDATYYNQDLPAALAALLRGGAWTGPRWSALVVDEGQDLLPEWVALLVGLLEDPERDPVLLLEDASQNLYRTVQHQLGTPWHLELNLRQHPAIRRQVWLACPDCGWDPPEPVADDGVVQFLASSPGGWQRDLGVQLEALSREGIRPEQALILSPHRLERFGVRDGMALGPWTLNAAPDWWEEEKAGQVRIGTVHSFKGLEADVVIYLGMAYPSGRAARLAYTAYSRARHRLIVLEQAIPKPKRVEPAAAAAPAATPAVTASPVRPQVRSFDERQREALMGALSAAKRWKPGGNRQGPRRGPSAGFGST